MFNILKCSGPGWLHGQLVSFKVVTYCVWVSAATWRSGSAGTPWEPGWAAGDSWVSVATTGRSQETAAQEGRLAFGPERTYWAEEAPDILSSFPNPCWPVLSPIPLASPTAPPPHLRTASLHINSYFNSPLGAWLGSMAVAVFVLISASVPLVVLCL